MTAFNPQTHPIAFFTSVTGINDFSDYVANQEVIWALDMVLSALNSSGILNIEITDTAPTDVSAIWVDPNDPATDAASTVKMFNTATQTWDTATFELFSNILISSSTMGASITDTIVSNGTVTSTDGQLMVNPTTGSLTITTGTSQSDLETDGFVTLASYIAAATVSADGLSVLGNGLPTNKLRTHIFMTLAAALGSGTLVTGTAISVLGRNAPGDGGEFDGVVEAGDNATYPLGGKVKPIRQARPEMWGTDEAAFEAATEFARLQKVAFFADGEYTFTRPVYARLGFKSFEMLGKIVGNFAPSTGPILTVYNVSSQTLNNTVTVVNEVTWINDELTDPVALRFAGVKGANITVHRTSHFQVFASTDAAFNALFETSVSSSAYNKFTIIQCSTISLWGEGVNAWINENQFDVRRIFGNTKPGRVIFHGDYGHNYNIFNGGTLEGECEITFDTGTANDLRDMRFERNLADPDSTLTITFADDCHSNNIETGWVSSAGYVNNPYGSVTGFVTVVDPSGMNTVSHVQEKNSIDIPVLSLNVNAGWVGSANNNQLSGLRGNTTIPNVRNVESRIGGKLAIVNSNNEIFVDLQSQYRMQNGLMVAMQSDQQFFRMAVHIFDADGRAINAEPAVAAFVGPGTSWVNGLNGKGYYSVGANGSQTWFRAIDDTVAKFFAITLSSGNAVTGLEFESVDIIIRAPKTYEQRNIRRSRGWANAERMRGQSPVYFNDADIDMTKVEQGVPAFKLDGTERKVNVIRSTNVITAISGASLTVWPNVQVAPTVAGVENRIRYKTTGSGEASAAITSASGSTITLPAAIGDLTVGDSISFVSTVTTTESVPA